MKRLLTQLPVVLLGLGLLLGVPTTAPAQKKGGIKPKPDVENAKYGPHERNVLDLWKAKSGTSLWIGFHDDMADPKNPDPVLRQSTRLTCMAVSAAQSSYDPRVIKEWVGEPAAKHPALQGFYGLKPDELDTPKAHKLYEAASPVNYLTKDDPPVYAFYGDVGVVPADAKPGQGIHHINFGLRLKEKMDALKIECTIRSRKDRAGPEQEMVEFFVKHLNPGRDK